MWSFASAVLLFVGVALADPQRGGYGYLPPPNVVNLRCDDIISVVYQTSFQNQVIPTTIRQANTQYRTTTSYSQRVVATTQYRTQIQTRVQYQTSLIQRETQIQRDRVVTRTQRGQDRVETRYETSIRVVPQVSYVTRTQIRTQVVPVEVTNTRVETRYQDQVQFQTIPVQQTTTVRVPGRNVVSTIFNTQTRSSIVQNQQPAQTRFQTTTRVQNQIQTQTVPSPPVIRTSIVQSRRVITSTVVRTNFQTRFVTQTRYVTRTQVQTQTQIQTQVVPQEVVVTKDVPREIVTTQYQTRVVPMTQFQTQYQTRYNTGRNDFRTQTAFVTSTVYQPGRDRVVTSEVVRTQSNNQIRYQTNNVQRQVVVTRTVQQTCGGGGYNYNEPSVPFRF